MIYTKIVFFAYVAILFIKRGEKLMKREYLEQPTKGVWCKPVRMYPVDEKNSVHKVHVFTSRQGNAAFPVSPDVATSI